MLIYEVFSESTNILHFNAICRVVDPYHFEADQDSTYHPDADSGPGYQNDADPQPWLFAEFDVDKYR